MRISDWSSDVCSSDLDDVAGRRRAVRMEDVAGEDRRACFLAEVPDVGAAALDGRRVVFHEDGLRRAARQGLEAECAGSGAGVEHARLQQGGVSTGDEVRKSVLSGKGVYVRRDMGGRVVVKTRI